MTTPGDDRGRPLLRGLGGGVLSGGTLRVIELAAEPAEADMAGGALGSFRAPPVRAPGREIVKTRS